MQDARMSQDCLVRRRLNSWCTHHNDFTGEREAQEVTQDRKLVSQTPLSEPGGKQRLLAAERVVQGWKIARLEIHQISFSQIIKQ